MLKKDRKFTKKLTRDYDNKLIFLKTLLNCVQLSSWTKNLSWRGHDGDKVNTKVQMMKLTNKYGKNSKKDKKIVKILNI